jgi:TATA-box binding protein (TBP) (component of TFIID and TFIIIB)
MDDSDVYRAKYDHLPPNPDNMSVKPPFIFNIVASFKTNRDFDRERASMNMRNTKYVNKGWHALVKRLESGHGTISVFPTKKGNISGSSGCIENCEKDIQRHINDINDVLPPNEDPIEVVDFEVRNIMTVIRCSHEIDINLLKSVLAPGSWRNEPEVHPSFTFRPRTQTLREVSLGKKTEFFNFYSTGNIVLGNCKTEESVPVIFESIRPWILRCCRPSKPNVKFGDKIDIDSLQMSNLDV